MEARLDAHKAAPGAYRAMLGLQDYVNKSGLEPAILELVKIRASQINGCAFCLAMHVRDARKMGESDERLHLVAAWREAPFYTPRERAALAWTEALTLVAESRVPDEVYAEASRHFTPEELVKLTMAVVAINGWNRINVAFRTPPVIQTEKAA